MLDLASCSDGELAALALAGRQAAFSELMRRHRDTVFRVARGQVGADDAALDITQQSFISAFSALAQYDGERPFRHWISRITINKCRDWARRRRVRQFFTFAQPLDDARDVAVDQPDAESGLADRQELQRTMSAVAGLPTKLKDVLVLRTIEGLSQAEVGSVLGISPKAVETRLYRARAKLSEILRD